MVDDWGYGSRIDGTQKGPGFAAQRLPDGSVMTEFSAVWSGISTDSEIIC